MFITIDPSRLTSIYPLIQIGDQVDVKLPQFKVDVRVIIKGITTAGATGTMAENRHRAFTHWHGNKYWNGNDKEVFTFEWVQITSVYMKG